MNQRMDANFPHSTGLCPLSELLPKKQEPRDRKPGPGNHAQEARTRVLGLEERGWELGPESRAQHPGREEDYRERRPGYKRKGARAQTLGLRACW